MNATTAAAQVTGKSRSISRRLVNATLVISLLVSVVVIAVQLLNAYRTAQDNANFRLDEVGKSIVPSIASSLWQVDTERVNLLLDGIVRLPEISYVRLDSNDGDHYERGNSSAAALATRDYSLQHNEGKSFDMGSLHVVVGRKRMLGGVIDDAIATAFTTALVLVCSALLLSLFFRLWVTRHLETMAAYAGKLSFENLDDELVLPSRAAHGSPDEIDQLVLAFNGMRDTLRSEADLRDRFETELMLHRERLEELVTERTSQLERKTDELQQQKDEMQQLAQTDSLTGASNRRHLRELAEHEMARSERSGTPLSMLMLDIDYFKRINDGYGHDVGDLAIKALCSACARELRQCDALGRWGGEEFAVLLAETDSASARHVAERIRAAVSEIRIGLESGDVVAFTVSVGLATFDSHHTSLDAVLKGADKALYAAKQSGRDRVCVSET